jgi:cysteine synthase B
MTYDKNQTNPGSSHAERIGNTPLVRLDQLVRSLAGITLLGKAEWANPGGSVMDRAAVALVRDALSRGFLTPGKTVLEATTGSTGISLATLGAALDFPVHLAIPSNISSQKKQILATLGAQVDWTEAEEGIDGAIRRARELVGNDPARFCYMDQFSNDANWQAHFQTTGPEIWQQTAGLVTHLVAGIGTSGTFIGTSRSLKGYNPKLQAISVLPDSAAHGIEGLKYRGDSIIPPIYNPHLANGTVVVETGEAHEMVKRIAREEGLLVGVSAAAAVIASLKIAHGESEAGRRAVIVAILPDSAERYLGSVL